MVLAELILKAGASINIDYLVDDIVEESLITGDTRFLEFLFRKANAYAYRVIDSPLNRALLVAKEYPKVAVKVVKLLLENRIPTENIINIYNQYHKDIGAYYEPGKCIIQHSPEKYELEIDDLLREATIKHGYSK